MIDDDVVLQGYRVPTWEKFCLRFIVWPTVVQLFIIPALVPVSWFWRRLRLSDSSIIFKHVGTKHSKPSNPAFLALLLGVQLVSSLVSVCIWVRRTYVRRCDDFLLEGLISLSFVFGYLVRILRNEFRPVEAMTLACVIDVYTSIPLLMENDDSFWVSLSFLRVFRALDALNQIESTGVLDVLSDFRRALMFLLLRALCMVVVLAGIVFTLEVLGDPPMLKDRFTTTGMGDLSFVSVMYFSISTISTVGYGDFTPSTLLTRIFVCIEIVVGVCFFSVETTNIVELKNLLNTGKGSYRYRRGRQHVVVIGGGVRNAGEVLNSLLKEIFGGHERYDPGWPDVVLLCPTEADRSLKESLKEMPSEKRRHVFYFVGSPMVSADLERVAIHQVAMVYVIADVSARDKRQEDGFNLLRALSVKKYSPRRPVRLMLLRPEFKERAVNAGVEGEHCFSVDEMKATFMAHCCRCPGFITVISNLMDSQGVPEDHGGDSWVRDYFNGSNNAIYGAVLGSSFVGKTWAEAISSIYMETGSIVIAAQVEGRVVLNPGQYTALPLEGGEVVFVIAAGPCRMASVSDADKDWQAEFRSKKKRASCLGTEPPIPRQTCAKPLGARPSFRKQNSLGARLSKLVTSSSLLSQDAGLVASMSAGPSSVSTASTKAATLASLRKKEGKLAMESLKEQMATVTNMVSSDAGGHIVLISCSSGRGVHWNEIALMMYTLRTPMRPWEHKPIMVLTPEAPPSALAKDYHNVSFCVGTPSNVDDLEAVMVSKASVVVLLAGDAQGEILSELRDHNAIVVASTLDLLLTNSDHTFVMYELHVEASAKFMPCPMVGMQTILADTTTGDRGSRIRSIRLRHGRTVAMGGHSSQSQLPVKMESQFACGQVFSLSFLGEMLGREFYVPSTMELLQALVMPARRGQSSFPWLVHVPEEFVGHPFEDLFKAWVEGEDMAVPISLYRHVQGSPEQYGYVLTNPDADLVLYETDRVYVMASAAWGQKYTLLSRARQSKSAGGDSDSAEDIPTPPRITLQENQALEPLSMISLSKMPRNSTRSSARCSYVSGMSITDYEDRMHSPLDSPTGYPSEAVSVEFRAMEERVQGQIASLREDVHGAEAKMTEHLCRVERQLELVTEALATVVGGTAGSQLSAAAKLARQPVPMPPASQAPDVLPGPLASTMGPCLSAMAPHASTASAMGMFNSSMSDEVRGSHHMLLGVPPLVKSRTSTNALDVPRDGRLSGRGLIPIGPSAGAQHGDRDGPVSRSNSQPPPRDWRDGSWPALTREHSLEQDLPELPRLPGEIADSPKPPGASPGLSKILPG